MRKEALRSILIVCTAVLVGCQALTKHASNPRTLTPRMSSMPIAADDPPPTINPPPMPIAPETTSAGGTAAQTLRRLADEALKAERSLDNYCVRLRRRVRTGDNAGATELMMLKQRRVPFSLHLKWLGDQAQGREILFVKGRFEDKVQILTGRGDLLGTHLRLAFSPDSAIVRAKLTYDIHETGFAAAVKHFTIAIAAMERKAADAGTVQYRGRQMRPELPSELESAVHQLPAGVDPLFPRGGARFYYFDIKTGLPVIVQSFDEAKREVEYYCFDRLQNPIGLDDSDFDPAHLWPKRN